MKKIFSIFGIGFLAAFTISLSHATEFDMKRSTVIKGGQTDILLTTATIIAWRIEVSSGFTGSSFRINGGTETKNKTSTFTYDTGSTENRQNIEQLFGGAILTTVGNSETRFYWDFLHQPPRGEESKGLDVK